MQNISRYSQEQLRAMSDDALIELIRQGEPMATEFLVEKYTTLIRAKARSYFLIGADGEDVIQEGMIGFYKAIRDYQPEGDSSFKVFAEMCITRQIITAIKTANRKKHSPLNTYISLNEPVWEEEGESLESRYGLSTALTPEQLYIGKESVNSLYKRIEATLSTFEFAVFEQYISGVSYMTIAEEMGKPMKSIDNALQRIKKKIEKCID